MSRKNKKPGPAPLASGLPSAADTSAESDEPVLDEPSGEQDDLVLDDEGDEQPQTPNIPPAREPNRPITSCSRCGSIERVSYTRTNHLVHDGKLVEWFRTKCAACGQARTDRIVTDAKD